MDPDVIVAAIRTLKPVSNRLEVVEDGGITWVRDAYNSNQFGFRAALEVAAALPATKRILVTPGVIEEAIGVNYIANHRLIRAMHPLLRASDAGRAVFLTTGLATAPLAYFSPYAASKAALEMLVLTYAAELNVTPIKANLFSPGPVRTSMRSSRRAGAR